MRTRTLFAAVVALLVAGAAVAGEQCTGTTQQCLDKMASSYDNRGWIGVHLDKADNGFKVTKVVEGSPAAKAGLRVGDVLVAMNGIPMAEKTPELKAAWQSLTPGQTVTYAVVRNHKEKTAKVKLARVPEDVKLQAIGMHMLQHAEASSHAQKSDG